MDFNVFTLNGWKEYFFVLLSNFFKTLPLTPDSYVVVRVRKTTLKKESCIFHVGYVMEKEGNDKWRIKLMRRHGFSYNKFVFTEEEEILLFSVCDVLQILSSPKLVRLVHHFPGDFGQYETTLL